MIDSSMNGLLCLKWNNHSAAFMKKITVLQEKELYSDATIVCHGKYYPVHRLILSTCSDYFEEIFQKIECKHPFIIMKDIKSVELEALLCYMYRGEINVLQDTLPGLIKAAESLKVKGLAVPDDINSNDSSFVSKTSRKIKEEPFIPMNALEDEMTNAVQFKNSFHSDVNRQNEKRLDNIKNSTKTESSRQILSSLEENTEGNFPFIKQEVDGDIIDAEENLNENRLSEQSLSTDESILAQFTDPLVFQPSQSQPQCSSWENRSISTHNLSNLDGIRDEIVRMCLLNPLLTSPGEDLKQKRTPSETEPLKCMSCSFRTKFKNTLRKHIRTCHKRDAVTSKKLKCKICGFEAIQKHTMLVHNRKHTGEKPYSCPTCSYTCAKKWNLVIHTRIHTGEKPHRCPYCPFASAYSNILNKHIGQKHKRENIL